MRRNVLGVLLVVMECGAGLAVSQAPVVDSVWQGTVRDGVEVRRVEVQVGRSITGMMAATGVYVEFLHDAVGVDSSVVTGTEMRFAVGRGEGVYEGKVSADGASALGTWTWEGKPVELVLRRVAKDSAWKVPFQYQYHYRDVTYARPSVEEAKIAFSPRLAVDYMEQGALAWTKDWQCVACHTNGTYMVVRPMMTPQLGAPQKEMRDYFVGQLHRALAVDPAKRATEVEPTQTVYMAAGLAIWDAHVTHRLSEETKQAMELMFAMQRPGGDWYIEDDNNPPLESSGYQLATVAARAVANAPGWLAMQRGTPMEAKVNRLTALLRAGGKMQGDYDRTDLLWTAAEYPGLLDAKRMAELKEMVLEHQQMDGGWSIRTFALPEEWGKGNRAEKLRAELEFGDPRSDGHMTGLAIIALRKAGVPESDPRIQRGVAWLLANQRASGRWYTRSLNRDGWQFITYSGTAYPLLALAMCDALPGQGTSVAAVGGR
jgi:squalene-hopene/tetraprenyl-beta-curcumene cyclase